MTFEELKAARFVPLRECSICGVQVGYRVHPTMVIAVFDPSCDCPGARGHERIMAHAELATLELPAEANQ